MILRDPGGEKIGGRTSINEADESSEQDRKDLEEQDLKRERRR
jgi:hypothetical protein